MAERPTTSSGAQRSWQAALELAAIVDSSGDAILSKDLDGTIMSWNPAAERLFGYTAEEAVGRPVSVLIPTGQAGEERDILERIKRGERIDHFETLRRRKDGMLVAVALTISPIKAPDGTIAGASTIARDISARQEADAARFHLAAIVDSSDDAILSKALDGTILSWNLGAQGLYGYSADEVVGKSIAILVPPDRTGEVTDILTRIKRGERIDHFETVRRRKDGGLLPVALTISPIRNAEDEITGASTIARDISEREGLTRALHAAAEEARTASRLKSEFLATMSHEIRTPMNGVIGMTGLLLDTELDSEQREYAETVRSSGEALLAIINDILDFSKIEAGKLDLEIIDFDLRPVVEELVELLAERAHAKGLELMTVIEADVPARLRGDPGRLRQVLTNLLGNAIKFTERGEILARVMLGEPGDRKALLCFEVGDTGPGIASESQAALFDAFSQTDATTTRTHGGTGLGLAISKQLAELMGGEIGVESESGAGSKFWFTARFGTFPALPAAQIRDSVRDLAVLIVDDNETNRKILCHQIGSWGMRAHAVEDAGGALAALRAGAAAGEPYDIAILDMDMPGMDGLQLAGAIRADATLGPIPLVLLTSARVRGAAREARRAGLDAYLTKPVRQSQLYDCLATVTSARSEPSELITTHVISEARARARPRLLVAEDNTVNQRLAVAMLAKIGYRADVAANGAEALAAISEVPYGAVLMDCQMPEMDGYQATAAIRARENGSSHIPIIAMTAGAMTGDRERCLAAGMDDYIPKPVKVDELDAVLKRWVPEPPGGSGGSADVATSPAGLLDAARLEDLRSLQQDGEPDMLAALVEAFLEQARHEVAELKIALSGNDPAAVAALAHSLKGSSANIGAERMGARCGELEARARSGGLGGGDEAAGWLEAELERVRLAFEAEDLLSSS